MGGGCSGKRREKETGIIDGEKCMTEGCVRPSLKQMFLEELGELDNHG